MNIVLGKCALLGNTNPRGQAIHLANAPSYGEQQCEQIAAKVLHNHARSTDAC